MTRPLEICIAARAFGSLILDYEWPGDEWTPPLVSCRVLIEDFCVDRIHASSRDEAIEKFRNWRR